MIGGLISAFWKMSGLLVVLAALQMFAASARAVEPDEILKDPKLEQRARDISLNLRCLVCQNQSIDDSNAELAKDLRVLVRERLKEGDSNEDVVQYVVDRYGEFVLLKPRFGMHTLVLWLGPFALLLIGGYFGYRTLQNRQPRPASAGGAPGLSEDEKQRLAKLMKDD